MCMNLMFAVGWKHCLGDQAAYTFLLRCQKPSVLHDLQVSIFFF